MLSGNSMFCRHRRRRVFLIPLLVLLLIVIIYSPSTSFLVAKQFLSSLKGKTASSHIDSHGRANTNATDHLEDIVLVIKTGATESLKKIPAHLNTTLQSWPHVLLLSDLEEQIGGYQLHDALAVVSDKFHLHDPTFELWRSLRNQGRSDLATSEPETSEQL